MTMIAPTERRHTPCCCMRGRQLRRIWSGHGVTFRTVSSARINAMLLARQLVREDVNLLDGGWLREQF